MKIVTPEDFTDITSAQSCIKELQQKLLECEQCLDDIARCAEICVITNQFHLLRSFIDSSNEYLKDRLDLIEFSEREKPEQEIVLIENEVSAQSS